MSESREFYRKKVNSTGYLIQSSGEEPFQTRDLALDGFQAHFDDPPPCEEGAMVRVRLPA